MYLENKYSCWYFNIINNARTKLTEGYTEKHHIVPRSLGGGNSKSNIVNLTAREHFVCHLLLTKMTTGCHRAKMIKAAAMMSGKSTINSKLYAKIRSEYASIRSAESKGSKNHFFGKTHTPESIDKMKESLLKLYSCSIKKDQIKHARTMWRHNRSNKKGWLMADKIYNRWVEINQPFCFQKIEQEFGFKYSSLQSIITHFVKGWIPLKDPEWVHWRNNQPR